MLDCQFRFPGPGMMPRYPGPHFSGTPPPRGPPTPQTYPSMAHMQQMQGHNGPQNVMVGPGGHQYIAGPPGHGQPQYYPQHPQTSQPQSQCGTPSVASLQMV